MENILKDIAQKDIKLEWKNNIIKTEKQIYHHGTCSTKNKSFKIIVLGDSNVGKTSILYRLCESKFLSNPRTTVGMDFREKTLTVDGEEIKLQLWDTAGEERFRTSIFAHYYRNADAVIFVYDVTKLSAFEGLNYWIEECNSHNLTREIPSLLIGNKCDSSETRAVQTSVAQKFADLHNMSLYETSAKEECQRNNINEIFLTLACKLKNQKAIMMLSPSEKMQEADVIVIRKETHKATITSEAGSCFC